METVRLHQHPELLDDCADVLNEEWSRSKAARLHSLEKSCDTSPCSFVLIKTDGEKPCVIGHSRISNIKGKENSCLVESVVVWKALRGHGLGRFIMEQTEAEAVTLGFRTMYLTTHDKQDFYHHLGYQYCQPVVSFGFSGANFSPDKLQQLLDRTIEGTGDAISSPAAKESGSKEQKEASQKPSQQSAPPPPAPPPPLISTNKHAKSDMVRWDSSKLSWMKKELT